MRVVVSISIKKEIQKQIHLYNQNESATLLKQETFHIISRFPRLLDFVSKKEKANIIYTYINI